MNRTLFSRKVDCVVIAAIQYAFLLFYINYSNALFNSELIMLVIFALLGIALTLRLILRRTIPSLLIVAASAGSVIAFVCSYLNGSGFGSAVTQASLLLAVCFLAESSLTRCEYRRIAMRMIIVLVLILVMFSRTDEYDYLHLPIPQLSYFDPSVTVNPNTIAIMWFFLLVFEVIFINTLPLKVLYKNLIIFSCTVLCTAEIWHTDSRSVLIAAVLFAFLIFICVKPRKKWLLAAYMTFLIISVGATFLYVGLYELGVGIDLTFFGKSFYSGRQKIWSEAFALLKNNIILGFSNKVTFTEREFSSLHNSLLSVLCYFGIFGLVANIAVFFAAFKRICTGYARIASLALISCTVIMAFETLTTDWSLLWPLCLIFLSANGEIGAKPMRRREVISHDT